MSNNLNSEEAMSEKECYERAIEAYQFQVGRYHTWMNYYSIFTGAFFVALYTVWDKGDTAQSACCKCCNAVASSADNFLPFVIIILGWVASVCWLASLIGHRAWMGSWLRIVKMWEKKVLSSDDFVYQKVIIVKDVEKEKDNFCETKTFVSSYISTQKITTGFVCAIILAWELMFCYLLIGKNGDYCLWIIGAICSIALLGFILWWFWCCRCCLISDNVKGMVKKQEPETGNIQ